MYGMGLTCMIRQVAQVRFLVPARTKFRVEKVARFCNPVPVSWGTFSSNAIEIIQLVKKKNSSASKGFPHLAAWEYRIQERT
jgi:transcription initiation factor TFIIIB Brf1 subunit/transcription initiation factor TFIIB